MKISKKYSSIIILELEQLLLVSLFFLIALELLKTGLVTNYYNLGWHAFILFIIFILDIVWVPAVAHMSIKKIPFWGLVGGFLIFVLSWIALGWPWYFIAYLSLTGLTILYWLTIE